MQETNNLFEEPWWLDIVAPGEWSEAVSRDKKGDIRARIAYVHHDKRVDMPPFTQTLGVWMRDELKKDYGAQKEVLYELFEEINRHKQITVRLAPENEYVLPFRWMGYHLEPWFTYRIAGLEDCGKLYGSFNKTAKKNIKSAKNKVTIHHETDLNVLHALLDKTFEVQGRKNPMPKEVIRRIVETCDRDGHGQYMDARDKEGNVHSCAYFVYDDKVCYYLLGASDTQFRSSGAQSLILWEGIQMAAGKSRAFDFEGSMVEGIENFFRQFGGRCIPYYEVRKNGVCGDLMAVMKPRVKKIMGYKI